MRYFLDTESGMVYGYQGDDQGELIAAAIAAEWQEVTGNWPAEPSDDQKRAECKAWAKKLLLRSDFSQMPDVAAVLKNRDAWSQYRAKVRALFLEPDPNPVWPDEPEAVWE